MLRVIRYSALSLLMLALLIAPPPAFSQGDTREFPETGKTVSGPFLDFWDSAGGLDSFGLPVNDERDQRSASDGKIYKTQYFEQVVLEYHPARKSGSKVIIEPLGKALYTEKYPDGAPGEAASNAADAISFKETGKSLGGRFLQYWQAEGGQARHGVPVSNEFRELGTDGRHYTVQYFERSVFVYHGGAAVDVELKPLGKDRYSERQREISRTLSTLQSISRFVERDYIYTDTNGLDWDKERDAYADKIRISAGKDQAYELISELIDKLGDEHSGFLSPSDVEFADEPFDATKHSNIDVWLQDIAGAVRISFIEPDSPAERNGLHVFDVIEAVDGVQVSSSGQGEYLLYGAEGSPVTVTVKSPGAAARRVTMLRESFSYNKFITAWRLPGTNIGYLNLHTFDVEDIDYNIYDAVWELLDKGPLDGLIIDERMNSGGYINEEQATLSMFVEGGLAGSLITREDTYPIELDTDETIDEFTEMPIAILVSEYCYSACEHFAAGMHDLGRATVIGTHSAGNTEVIYPYDFRDGSRLYLAGATFERADGSSLEHKGVRADHQVDVAWYDFPQGEDPQVKAAIKILGEQR